MTAKPALRKLFARLFVPLLLLLGLFSTGFTSPADGQTTAQTTVLTKTSAPLWGIIQTGGDLWAVDFGNEYTCFAGNGKCGSIHQIQLNPGADTVYHAFNYKLVEGAGPGNLVEGTDGYVWGTTVNAGPGGTASCSSTSPTTADGCGTFYDGELTVQSDGLTELTKVLHPFTYHEGGQGGAITLGSDGNYYGVTSPGGVFTDYGNLPGNAYVLTPSGQFTKLAVFTDGDPNDPRLVPPELRGAAPNQLLEGDDGNLYGVSGEGNDASGAPRNGAFFRMSKSGVATLLATFPYGNSSGYPTGQLVEGPDQAFYGVTGAAISQCFPGFALCGTIFHVTKTGQITTLHTFATSDGTYPLAGLLLGADGVLYGTTYNGGDTTKCVEQAISGCGTLFSINTDGSNFQVLHTFEGGADGAHPSSLIQGHFVGGGTANTEIPGVIFGTAGSDGVAGSPAGVVFQTVLPTGHQLDPVQVQVYKASDMSPVPDGGSVPANTPLVVKWRVLNAFSNTMQKCYASASSGSVFDLPGWTGYQSGTLSNSVYSGQADLTIDSAGSFGLALNCGGVESASASITTTSSVTVTTATLPNATVSQNYAVTLAVNGGTGPYTWSVTSGSLPAGVNLDTTSGTISGTPKQFGNYTFTVQVKDSSSTPQTSTADLTLLVKNGLAVNPALLASAKIGAPYSQTLTVTGGVPPYTLTIGAGALPDGLTLNSTNGVISGTPTKAGNFSFTLTVADSENPQASITQVYALKVVSKLLTIDTTALPPAGVNENYAQSRVITGGVSPYNATLTSGTLPKGLGFVEDSGSLAIAGTPQQYGPGSPVTFQITDSDTPPQVTNATFTIAVQNTLKITTPVTLPPATFGVPYSYQALATGGLPQYTWTAGGGLSNLGLSFDANNGIFHGTPTVTGTYTGGLVVTDSEGKPASDSEDVFITINPPAGAALSSTSLTASSTTAGVGQSVTFTAKVSVAAGTPLGIITFAADGKTLGTASLTNGVATLTTSFSAVGVYNVIASYPGDEADQASGSKPVAVAVVTPSVTGSISPSSLTIKSGKSGTLTITVTPTGGYTGTVSFSCGTLPKDVSCTFAPPSLTIAAGSGPITDTLTINTAATQSAMLSSPLERGRPSQPFPATILWLPGSLAVLIGVFPRKRKRPFARRLWMLAILFLALGGAGTLSGCGGMSNDARAGTYSIPVTLTLASGAPQTVSATVIVQ